MTDSINIDLTIKLFDQLKDSHEKMSNQIEKLSDLLSTYISSEYKPSKQELKDLIIKNKNEYLEKLRNLEITTKSIENSLKEISDIIGADDDTLFHHIDNIGKINDTKEEVTKLVDYIDNLKKTEYSENDIENLGGFIRKINEILTFVKSIKSKTAIILGSVGLLTSAYGIIKFFEYLINHI